MDTKERIEFLERQVEALEREKVAAFEALDMAASLGSFTLAYGQQGDDSPVMKETCRRANLMMSFRNTAIYLIDEATNDLGVTYHDRPEFAEQTDFEIGTLIQDQSFAYAMQTERPCFFRTSTKEGRLILHSLATSSRVKGMFVGWMEAEQEDSLDTGLSLFSVVMLAAAHALESNELNRRFHAHREYLEQQVDERTAQLLVANEQLHSILDNLPSGVLMVDEHSQVVMDVNPAGLQMIGASLDDVVGEPSSHFLRVVDGAEEDGEVGENGERFLVTSSGDKIPVLGTVSRIALGGRNYCIENFIDVSEQKKLERMKEDIERITRHDLKSPLTGIIGLPDLLMAKVEMGEQEKEWLMGIKQAGYKMLKLINMSLDLYKMETGRYDYNPVEVDMAAVLRSSLADLSGEVRAGKLQIQTTIDGRAVNGSTPFVVQSEEFLLYSLLANLLLNAMEASPVEGVVQIVINGGSDVVLEIRNKGAVPEEIRDTFFDKYVTSGKKQGTGLGSYSAKLMAETMGGQIAMQTSEDEGTCIRVVLPQ